MAEDTVQATGRMHGGTAPGRLSDVATDMSTPATADVANEGASGKREPRALPHMQPTAVEAVRKAQVIALSCFNFSIYGNLAALHM